MEEHRKEKNLFFASFASFLFFLSKSVTGGGTQKKNKILVFFSLLAKASLALPLRVPVEERRKKNQKTILFLSKSVTGTPMEERRRKNVGFFLFLSTSVTTSTCGGMQKKNREKKSLS